MSDERNSQPVPETEKKKRPSRSAEVKYNIFLEASRGDVAVTEVIRKHGIHSSELQRIREKVRLGALKELSGKRALVTAEPTGLTELRAEKERLERALLELTIEHQLLKKRRVEAARSDRRRAAGGRN